MAHMRISNGCHRRNTTHGVFGPANATRASPPAQLFFGTCLASGTFRSSITRFRSPGGIASHSGFITLHRLPNDGAVVEFHEEHEVRRTQPLANNTFEFWKARRSRCSFGKLKHVRMTNSSFNRGQYFVEWPGRDQTESLDLNCGYHRDAPVLSGSPRAPRVSGQSFSKPASRCSPRSNTALMRFWAAGHPRAVPNEVKAARSRSDCGNETSLTRCFAAARARRSKEAIRRARASTKTSNSASGSDRFTYPYRSAVSPSKSLALKTISK